MIKHQCTGCGRHFVLPDSFGGRTQPCSGCGRPLHVPRPQGSDAIQVLPSAAQGANLLADPVLEVELEPLEPEGTIPARLPDFPPGLSLELDAVEDEEDIPELPLVTPASAPPPAVGATLRWFRGEDFANAAVPDLPTIFIDNFSTQALRLQLNGLPWRTVPSGSSMTTVLRRGSHSLTVLAADSGDELERRTLEVGADPHYVLNLLRAQVYTRGVAYYGPVREAVAAPLETRVNEAWFAVREEYVFQEPPASLVVSDQASFPQTRTFLRRGGPLALPAE